MLLHHMISFGELKNFQPEDDIGSDGRTDLEGPALQEGQVVSGAEEAEDLDPSSENVGDIGDEVDGRETDKQRQKVETMVSDIIRDLDERELRLRRGELRHLREMESKSGISFMVEVNLDQAIRKAEEAGAEVGELREQQAELRRRIARLDREFLKG